MEKKIEGRIKISQFREAMTVVEIYCEQVYRQRNPKSIIANEIGCCVKLSDFGKENLPRSLFNKQGIVVDWLEWHSPRDGLVTVKWDGVKKPVIMHIHNVVATSPSPTHKNKLR